MGTNKTLHNRDAPAAKQSWQPMRVTYIGHVREIVQTSVGGGKFSLASADPGEELTVPYGQYKKL